MFEREVLRCTDLWRPLFAAIAIRMCVQFLFVFICSVKGECFLFEHNLIDRREIFDHKDRSYSGFVEVSTFPFILSCESLMPVLSYTECEHC